ncbi:uncharacterized protein F5147DRAFT_658969 [Suillus discolor]|uniref:Uncharacterized protein n=1 Tax=Suillus discolor TaxID=1912936 RepID=A0A9P7ETF3_9AGAM|nr:uncharacterized protein F5147DRAFT_658969 [Suillus discolor]KAG2087465.1 hypothetical protein F5147DRAFT_658969 [Suillus discolor]
MCPCANAIVATASLKNSLFDKLEPGRVDQSYHDSLGMNRPNIGDYLDVALAQDWWEDSRSLDMGFDQFPSQPVSDPLDMGFPPSSNTNQSSIATPISELDMRFPPGHSSFNTNDSWTRRPALRTSWQTIDWPVAQTAPLDMGFNSPPVHHGHPDLDMGFHSPVQHSHPDQTPVDMGFDSPVPHHDPDQMSLDMGFDSPPVQHHDPDQRSLDMGFDLPVVHDYPDQRPSGIDPVDIPDQAEPEPMGFVIQRAEGDLRLAIHWLEMERAHGTMSPEEALVSEEVLQSTIHSMKCDYYTLCISSGALWLGLINCPVLWQEPLI